MISISIVCQSMRIVGRGAVGFTSRDIITKTQRYRHSGLALFDRVCCNWQHYHISNSREVHATSNAWHSRWGAMNMPTSPASFNVRYFGSASSEDNKNNNHNASLDGSTNNEPKFQDKEVPLYSFLNNEEQTSLDNKSSTADKKQQQQQPPLPTMSKMLTILIPEYKGLLPAATMQYPNAIGEIIDILSASNIAMLDVDTTASAATSSGIIEASSDISSTPIVDTQPQQSDQLQHQMQSISLQMLSYFTIGAVATFIHSALFDSIGQKIGAGLRKEF